MSKLDFKIIVFPFILGLLINACGTKPLTKLDDRVFEESRSYTVFTPDTQEIRLSGDVSLIVRPVDPSYLNKITYEAAVQTGGTESASLREIRRLEQSESHDQERIRKLEQLLSASNALKDNYQNKFDDELIDRIILKHSFQLGINQQLDYQTHQYKQSEYPHNFNPYFVNERYLSTVKLTFINRGNTIQRFRNDQFSVVFQGNSIRPHSDEYFEQRLTNSRQVDNVYNFNLPEEISVGPGQEVIRYIGVHPLPDRVESFSLQFVSEDNFHNSDFNIERENISLSRVFKGFKIDDRGGIPQNVRQRNRYYLLINNGQVEPISNHMFYIHEGRMGLNSSICAIFHSRSATTFSASVTTIK